MENQLNMGMMISRLESLLIMPQKGKSIVEQVKLLNNLMVLLGEENEKRLRDAITDMLIEQIKYELDNTECWLVDYEAILDEIREEVTTEVKEKVREQLMAKVLGKVDGMII